MIELLAPGGSYSKMLTAFEYGADAVYIGGDVFGLRANAENFTLEQMADAACYADAHQKKIYVTMNIIARNADLKDMACYARELSGTGVHGVIVSDPGAFLTIKEAAPTLNIHVSTQANNLNWRTCAFWGQMGAARVNLARELTLSEIADIHAALAAHHCEVELEAFVHGAMCMSYSGRCMLSDYFVNRSSNRGDCAQPCRWNYQIIESTRPEDILPAEENERGTFLFNSKDLCMIEHLSAFKEAGITSFKIEGRMKSEFYVAVTVRAYRRAIDAIERGEKLSASELQTLIDEVCTVSHRDYCTGFYLGERGSQVYETSSYQRTSDFIGIADQCEAAEKGYRLTLTQKGTFSVGDTLEFVTAEGPVYRHTVSRMLDSEGAEIERAPHAMMKVLMNIPFYVEKGCIIRRRKSIDYQTK